MSIMSILALTGSIIALGIGATTILGEGGYAFDLRRKRDRRRDAHRQGGRRVKDWA